MTSISHGTNVILRDDRPHLIAGELIVQVVSGADAGLIARIDRPRLTVGTAPTNELVLTDDSVSRHHLEIERRGECFLLRDLGSTNGTFVHGIEVREVVLVPGARIVLGESELLFSASASYVIWGEEAHERFGTLESKSPRMRRVLGMLARVAPGALSCVFIGGSGTGKEELARALHEESPRKNGPFVVVDCGSLSPTLAESELFGYERGAFTGAERLRVGAFEQANRGTLLLDEIGELPLALQPKLLRVLERREVRRLGGNAPISIDVRILSATHRDLEQMIEKGDFREDLFYRLAEVTIPIPPLSERMEDIPFIARRLLARDAAKGKPPKSIREDAIELLRHRHYPGNVRELRSLLRRAVACAEGGEIDTQAIFRADGLVTARREREASSLVPPVPLSDQLPIDEARQRWHATLEPLYLGCLLERTDGDIDLAAEEAQLHPKYFRRLLKRYGIV